MTRNDNLSPWREARFGLFIHWGLYALPAGYWRGEKQTRGPAEWIMKGMEIPRDEYAPLAERFNPVHFDAREWVNLAAEAGMKYLVFTAKHHDGFAMYRSRVCPYNVVDASPWGRDPLEELAQACRDKGLLLGIYYSHGQDWEARNGTNDWDEDGAPSGDKPDFHRYGREKLLPQVEELVRNYDPDLMWFDGEHGLPREYSKKIYDLVKRLKPACLVNSRVGDRLGDYGILGDNEIPFRPLEGDWETAATLNDNWGFRSDDDNWKDSQGIILRLADLASKGVNYLLNIGPDGEGRIPVESRRILEETGRWVSRNKEALYGSGAGPFPDEQDWGRMTVKGDRAYLFLFCDPGDKLILPGILSGVKRIYPLETGINPEELEFEALPGTAPGIEIKRPAEGFNPDPVAVLVLETEGELRVSQKNLCQSGGKVRLFAHRAQLHISRENAGRTREVEKTDRIAPGDRSERLPDHLTVSLTGMGLNWNSPEDCLSWPVRLDKGVYRAELVSLSEVRTPWEGGQTVEFSLEKDSVKKAGVESVLREDRGPESLRTQGFFNERTSCLGQFSVDETGDYEVFLKIKDLKGTTRGVAELILIREKD